MDAADADIDALRQSLGSPVHTAPPHAMRRSMRLDEIGASNQCTKTEPAACCQDLPPPRVPPSSSSSSESSSSQYRQGRVPRVPESTALRRKSTASYRLQSTLSIARPCATSARLSRCLDRSQARPSSHALRECETRTPNRARIEVFDRRVDLSCAARKQCCLTDRPVRVRPGQELKSPRAETLCGSLARGSGLCDGIVTMGSSNSRC